LTTGAAGFAKAEAQRVSVRHARMADLMVPSPGG
jgi:hypothetical protein